MLIPLIEATKAESMLACVQNNRVDELLLETNSTSRTIRQDPFDCGGIWLDCHDQPIRDGLDFISHLMNVRTIMLVPFKVTLCTFDAAVIHAMTVITRVHSIGIGAALGVASD